MGSYKVNRRDFVKVVLGLLGSVMGSIVGIPAIAYLIAPAVKTDKSDAWIPVGPLESYELGVPRLYNFTRTKVNGWEKTVTSYGVYVLKDRHDHATVFSNLCTHLSCRVTWQDDTQEYLCPCHDAQFAKDGRVLGGPPPKPLKTYQTKVEDGILLIHLAEG